MTRLVEPVEPKPKGPKMTLTSFDTTLKDLYPGAGQRIKQWVVESRREDAWALRTCPVVLSEPHDDNTGIECRNSGAAPWMFLDHDCCGTCNDLQDATHDRPDVAAWRALKAARPSITADRDAFSDEVQADFSVVDHPLLAAIRKAQR